MEAHIHFNDETSKYGRQFRRMLQLNEQGDDAMKDMHDMIIQMRDGDGSQNTHYDNVATRLGFDDSARARAAFEELASAYSKTKGGIIIVQAVDVVDIGGGLFEVNAHAREARDQLFSILRA